MDEDKQKNKTTSDPDFNSNGQDEAEEESEIEETDEEGNPTDALKKMREKLKICVEEKQKYLDGWQRDKADFINVRRRDEARVQDIVKFANENLISDIIPVLDSFQMAMANKEVWEKVDKNWRVGVEYIANQLKTILSNNGLKELNPVGEKFDPMHHEAVEFEKTEDESKNGIIIFVIQKGYSLNDKILKAPKVKVAEYEKNQ